MDCVPTPGSRRFCVALAFRNNRCRTPFREVTLRLHALLRNLPRSPSSVTTQETGATPYIRDFAGDRRNELGRTTRYDITLKRVYDVASEMDGRRILVERLWPRGLSKDKASLHHWLKEIAPSPELRRWYGHRPERWPEFQTRYLAELGANPEAVRGLEKLCAAGPVTFVFAARDTERNGAVALKKYLHGDRAA